MWDAVLCDTDELMVVANLLFDPIKALVSKVGERAGIGGDWLDFGAASLKQPVRIYQKAYIDYRTRFDDGIPCTACVVDIIRCRAVFGQTKDMLSFMDSLKADPKLEIVRLKNKFLVLSPSHFRNLLLNVRVCYCTKCSSTVKKTHECEGPIVKHIFEIQIHHKKILQLDEQQDTHVHYEFFRVLLQNEQVTELIDFVLEKQMQLFASISTIPVLLSMLIIVLDRGDHRLPSSVFELYSLAVSSSVDRSARIMFSNAGTDLSEKYTEANYARQMLLTIRKVAYANHITQRREFTYKQAIAAFSLHSGESEFEEDHVKYTTVWEQMIRSEDMPLIKVVSPRNVADPDSGLYQFSHMSFQEYLFLEELKVQSTWVDNVSLLDQAFYRNCILIAATDAETLAKLLPSHLDLKNKSVDPELLGTLLERAEHVVGVRLNAKLWKESEGLQLLAHLRRNKTLRRINVGPNSFTPQLHAAFHTLAASNLEKYILAALADEKIQTIDLRRAHFADGNVGMLVERIRANKHLKDLDLRDNPLIGDQCAGELKNAILEGSVEVFSSIPVRKIILNEPNLTELSLSVKCFHKVEIRVLSTLLQTCTSLKKVNFWGMHELNDDAGSKDVAAAVLGNSSIESCGSISLSQLRSQPDTIQSLDIYSDEPGIFHSCLLHDFVCNSKSIDSVTLNGLIPIKLLNDPNTLQLDLSARSYLSADAFLLAPLLQRNTTLTSLSLRNNAGIQGPIARELVQVCLAIPSIKILDLRGIQVGVEASIEFAPQIVANSFLQLFSNIPVAQIKNNDQSLGSAYEAPNGISILEACVLGCLIQDNRTFASMKLWDDLVDSSHLDIDTKWRLGEFLSNCLSKNKTLRTVVLDGNELHVASYRSTSRSQPRKYYQQNGNQLFAIVQKHLLQQCNSLQTFSESSAQSRQHPKEKAVIVELLKNNKMLRTISISQPALEDDLLTSIFEVIHDLPSLSSLHFLCPLTKEMAFMLKDAIMGGKFRLTTCNVRIPTDPKLLSEIRHIAQEKLELSHIEALEKGGNFLSMMSEISEDKFARILNSINSEVRYVRCRVGGARLSDSCQEKLLQVVQANPKLVRFDTPASCLTRGRKDNLGVLLAENAKQQLLEDCKLKSHCTINSKMYSEIPAIIASNDTNLINLTVDIKDWGPGASLVEALEKNTTIQTLITFRTPPNILVLIGKLLEKNKILKSLRLLALKKGAQGTEAIAKALAVNTTLEYLEVRMDGSTAPMFADSLRQNTSLTTFVASGSSNEIARVAEAMKHNKSLTKLELDSYAGDLEAGVAFADCLTANSTLCSLRLSKYTFCLPYLRGQGLVAAANELLCDNGHPLSGGMWGMTDDLCDWCQKKGLEPNYAEHYYCQPCRFTKCRTCSDTQSSLVESEGFCLCGKSEKEHNKQGHKLYISGLNLSDLPVMSQLLQSTTRFKTIQIHEWKRKDSFTQEEMILSTVNRFADVITSNPAIETYDGLDVTNLPQGTANYKENSVLLLSKANDITIAVLTRILKDATNYQTVEVIPIGTNTVLPAYKDVLSPLHVSLAHNVVANDSLEVFGLVPVARLRRNDPTLVSLDLSTHIVHESTLFVLAEILKTNSSLQHLNLGVVCASEYAVGALIQAVARHNRSLRSLQVWSAQNEYSIRSGSGKDKSGVVNLAVIEAIQSNNTLTYLHVEPGVPDQEAYVQLLGALAKNKTLRGLSYPCKLPCVGPFVSVLKENSTLQHLDLVFSIETEDQCHEVARALRSNKTLCSLTLDQFIPSLMKTLIGNMLIGCPEFLDVPVCPNHHKLQETALPDQFRRICSTCHVAQGSGTISLSCSECAYHMCVGCYEERLTKCRLDKRCVCGASKESHPVHVNRTLQRLKFGPQSWIPIREILNPAITAISMSNISDTSLLLVLRLLRTRTNMEAIRFIGNSSVNLKSLGLGAVEGALLASLVKANPRLRALRCTGFKMSGTAFKAVVRTIISQSSELDLLDVSDNSLGPEGFSYVQKLLNSKAKVQKLILMGNNLGVDDAQSVGFGLASNGNIKHLSVGSKSPISVEELFGLVSGVMEGDTTALRELSLPSLCPSLLRKHAFSKIHAQYFKHSLDKLQNGAQKLTIKSSCLFQDDHKQLAAVHYMALLFIDMYMCKYVYMHVFVVQPHMNM